jgi:formate dehydrogenase beta subunit
MRETNPFPGICGYVCHHPCEEQCIRTKMDEPLAIKSLRRFVVDYSLWSHGGKRLP